MERNRYLGHENQICGAEQFRLCGGRGDGMRILQVRNGRGTELTVTPDRCSDISRLTFMGRNMSYFSPVGYVAPAYYNRNGDHFLDSFTAGFLTTCGLTTVGGACCDGEEELPMHGTIGNTPAETFSWTQNTEQICIQSDIRDARLFAHKLILHRNITVSLLENQFIISDSVENYGSAKVPLMVLYHMNIGYPLLSENAELIIPSSSVTPRDTHAAEGLDSRLQMLPPQAGFQEQCYFYDFDRKGMASIYNPDLQLGLMLSFDASQLKYLCQWKMMGEHDYVLGLEPGNCTPDGRAAMRSRGTLDYLSPGEQRNFSITVTLIAGPEEWHHLKGVMEHAGNCK